MQRHDNPFHDLWLTEILNPTEFVDMFSPHIVKHAAELFGTSNVVVRGTQGSGKSMLLNLLSTTTRIAYEKNNIEYPGPINGQPFMACGVHLIRDNARIVASRLDEVPLDKRKNWAATTFADYLNYLLCKDMLDNILLLDREQSNSGWLKSNISINLNDKTREILVGKIVNSEVWFGYFDECKNLDEILKRLSFRLQAYRRYFNFNCDDLDKEVESSKTSIGEPMMVLSDALRESGVTPENTLFFLRIDQHEELYALEHSSGYGEIFRQVINRAIALREGRVSYRIGTRHYAWSDDVEVWGSGAKLENMRDYVTVDLDEIYRRPETGSTPFDDFAEDVFSRRLRASGFKVSDAEGKGALDAVFGKSLSADKRALRFAKSETPRLSFGKDWDVRWKMELEKMWLDGRPLQAKLGEAWLRQGAQQKRGVHRNRALVEEYPWLGRGKIYWAKERKEAALVQMAGAAIQSLIWSGRKHIIDLAGFNILSFMSVCRAIWGAWLRNTSDAELKVLQGLPRIPVDSQIIGIGEASKVWFDKLREGLDGDRRTNFINALGTWFSRSIREDKALSNPGHNGFSLLLSEFEAGGWMITLIKNSRDHGDLIESEHTTKSNDQRPRRKWYLHPLLCPYFRIQFVRTKEPIYTNVHELEGIYKGSQKKGDVVRVSGKKAGRSDIQRNLF